MEIPSNTSLSTVFAFLAFTAFTLISVVQVNRDPSETLMWINLALGVTGMVVVGVQVITRYRRRSSDA